jgi:hypothetical protein
MEDLGAPALWTLAPISVFAGMLMALVFRWTTDISAMRRATNLVVAHILEFRLFLDEPILVLRAQWNLLEANLRLLRLLILPCAILAIPSFFLFEELNGLYGRAPLKVGDAVVVSEPVQVPATQLKMPPGITIETPPVHGPGQVSWRVRATESVPVRRVKESNRRVAIPFPPARILHLHWTVWFALISTAAAIGMKALA